MPVVILRRINHREYRMGPRSLSPVAVKVLPLAALGVMLAIGLGHAASANPYVKLSGYWSGGGKVTPLKGNAEKVSCRATYKVEGAAVTQTVRCEGVEHKFAATFNLTYEGGKISGSWSEALYAASGGVSGTASGNSIRARLSGQKFAGRMSINVSGSRHTINIVQLDKGSGAYRPVASLALHR
jgi:hypothetical protein